MSASGGQFLLCPGAGWHRAECRRLSASLYGPSSTGALSHLEAALLISSRHRNRNALTPAWLELGLFNPEQSHPLVCCEAISAGHQRALGEKYIWMAVTWGARATEVKILGSFLVLPGWQREVNPTVSLCLGSKHAPQCSNEWGLNEPQPLESPSKSSPGQQLQTMERGPRWGKRAGKAAACSGDSWSSERAAWWNWAAHCCEPTTGHPATGPSCLQALAQSDTAGSGVCVVGGAAPTPALQWHTQHSFSTQDKEPIMSPVPGSTAKYLLQMSSTSPSYYRP